MCSLKDVQYVHSFVTWFAYASLAERESCLFVFKCTLVLKYFPTTVKNRLKYKQIKSTHKQHNPAKDSDV